MSAPAPKEKKQKPPGPLPERRAITQAKREQAFERDAARYRIANELRERTQVEIPPQAGYLVLEPGSIAGADAVVQAGNELIESIGHEALCASAQKGGFMAKEFMPRDATELDSPYMRFALSEDVVGPIAGYLGFVPLLTQVDIWYSVHDPSPPHLSQLWHLDHADTTQVKVWIHLNDVRSDNGPLTGLDATASDALADRVAYDLNRSYRIDDEQVEQVAGTDALVRFEGPPGTVDFVDTSRVFHFGSRVDQDAEPRRLFFVQYLTPYAFRFQDHREQAPLRRLAPGASSGLETLLLGAA
jgi:hypothetical protein